MLPHLRNKHAIVHSDRLFGFGTIASHTLSQVKRFGLNKSIVDLIPNANRYIAPDNSNFQFAGDLVVDHQIAFLSHQNFNSFAERFNAEFLKIILSKPLTYIS